MVFGLIAGVPLSISSVAAVRQPSFLKAFLICIAALAFAFVWLSRFRLVITPEAVTYSSLFVNEQTLQRSKISEAGFAERTKAFESPYTFVIRSSSGCELRINAKVFSPSAARELRALATA